MASKKSNPLMAYDPTPQQELDYHMERAIDKAVMNHPHTQKLRKQIAGEMRKAATAPVPATLKAAKPTKPKKKR